MFLYQQDLTTVTFYPLQSALFIICFYPLNRFKLFKTSVQLTMESVFREGLLLFILPFLRPINPSENQKKNQLSLTSDNSLPAHSNTLIHHCTHTRCPTGESPDFPLFVPFSPNPTSQNFTIIPDVSYRSIKLLKAQARTFIDFQGCHPQLDDSPYAQKS